MLRKINQSIVYSLWSIVKALSLCLLAAVLLIFSFPLFNFEILAWFGFVPLFFVLKNKPKGKAFLLAYFTGIIFWTGIIYWLVHVTFLGTIILVLYLALYFGIFGLIVSTIDYRLSTIDSLLFIPSLWVLLEYLRSRLLTGFPWALLGYSQYLNLPIIQVADITGAWGVSFLVMMVNVALKEVLGLRFWVLGRQDHKNYRNIITIVCLIFVSSIIYGYYKLHQTPNTKHQTPIKISVIQGNIPQELKWQINSREFIINRYIGLTTEAVKDKPDLIIWPEASLPAAVEEEPLYYEIVSNFTSEINRSLLLGAVTFRNNCYYNSALLLSDEGKLLNRYDKLHLVPFGEYIPLRKIIGFLETVVPIGDFTRGKEHTLFRIPGYPDSRIPADFSVLICFEDLFPELSRNFVNRGADFLVNITNDAWFGRTASPYQHLSASVFRAVENRVYLVRSANTGISGFIAPSGKIVSLVQDKMGRNMFISGYRMQKITIPGRDPSFYTRYGDIFVVICFLFMVYSIIYNFLNISEKLKAQSAKPKRKTFPHGN